MCKEIKSVFQKRGKSPSDALNRFLVNAQITEPISMREFFEDLGGLLENQRFVVIIDEFDSIPRDAIRGFLHSLRQIYLSRRTRCPHSIGIVGVKNITQLNYDRSISPFNIQDEFKLPNFTLEQVQELLSQYTPMKSVNPSQLKLLRLFTNRRLGNLYLLTDSHRFLPKN